MLSYERQQFYCFLRNFFTINFINVIIEYLQFWFFFRYQQTSWVKFFLRNCQTSCFDKFFLLKSIICFTFDCFLSDSFTNLIDKIIKFSSFLFLSCFLYTEHQLVLECCNRRIISSSQNHYIISAFLLHINKRHELSFSCEIVKQAVLTIFLFSIILQYLFEMN